MHNAYVGSWNTTAYMQTYMQLNKFRSTVNNQALSVFSVDMNVQYQQMTMAEHTQLWDIIVIIFPHHKWE